MIYMVYLCIDTYEVEYAIAQGFVEMKRIPEYQRICVRNNRLS